MKLITAERLSAMIDGLTTEAAVLAALRHGKIKTIKRFPDSSFDYYIPCKKGMIRLYRACSRSHPFMIRPVLPSCYPDPIPREVE